MRKAVCVGTLLFGTCAMAHTLAETNAVVSYLIEVIQVDGKAWLDTPEALPPFIPIKPSMQTYEELFEKCPTNWVGSSWTSQERRNVFEGVLWSILDLPTNRYTQGDVIFSNWMLRFCEKQNQTNFL